MPMVDTRIQLPKPAPNHILQWNERIDIVWINTTSDVPGGRLTYPALYLSRQEKAGDAPKNIIQLGDSQPLSGEYTWETGGEKFIPQGGAGYYFKLLWTEDGKSDYASAIGNYFTILVSSTSTAADPTETPTCKGPPGGPCWPFSGKPPGMNATPTPDVNDNDAGTTPPANKPSGNLQSVQSAGSGSDHSGTSSVAKIAIGASVGVGILAIMVAFLIFVLVRRRRKEKQRQSSSEHDYDEKGELESTAASGTIPRWIAGVPTDSAAATPLTKAPTYVSGFPHHDIASDTPTELQTQSEHRELPGQEVKPRVVTELPVESYTAHELDATETASQRSNVHGKRLTTETIRPEDSPTVPTIARTEHNIRLTTNTRAKRNTTETLTTRSRTSFETQSTDSDSEV